MAKEKGKLEFRYYDMPSKEYVLPLIGECWEQEYGINEHGMLHFHNYLEIGYCYKGKGILDIEDRRYRYKGEMFTIIPENIPHTTTSDPGNICKWEFLFVDIDEFIKNEMKDCGIIARDLIEMVNKKGRIHTVKNHQQMAWIIRNIFEECRMEQPYYKESLKGYLRTLVIEIIRSDEEREKYRKNIKIRNYVKMAIAYIEEHYAEDIKIADVAQTCGLSESHFRRNFEECMNMKPMDYINLIRVQNACTMIRKEELSMEEVGYKVGFITPSTFNRNFKKLTGMSPYQWKVKERKAAKSLVNYKITAKKGWNFEDGISNQLKN